jgi:predicted nucleic acid-binding Zn ribbon protein
MQRRVRRRSDGVQSLSTLVGQSLTGLQIARKIQEHTAPLVWSEVVGEQVSGATQVLGVDNGVLRITTKSSVWAHELTFYKADILRRLNKRLDAAPNNPVITDIHFQNRGIEIIDTTPPPPTDPTPSELDAVVLSPSELARIDASLAALPDERLQSKMRRARITEARLRIWRMDNGWVPCPDCGVLIPPLPGGNWNGCPRCRTIGRD